VYGGTTAKPKDAHMEPVLPGDVRVRLWETTPVSNPQPTARVLLDSQQGFPGNIGLADLLQASTILTPDQSGRPTQDARILLLDGNRVRNYNFNSVLGGATDLYLGPFPIAPASNPDGTALVAGNTYFNTTDKNSYVWNGESWQIQGLPQPATLKTYVWYTATPQTAFVGADDLGEVFQIDPTRGDTVAVYVNGAKQAQSADYFFTSDGGVQLYEPTCAGAVVEITVFVAHTVTNQVAPTAVDTSLWVFDDIGREFPLYDYSGQPIAPDTPTQCLVLLDDGRGGNWALNPVSDFTVIGAEIIFAVPPPASASPGAFGSKTWMVVGLPLIRPATVNALSAATAPTPGESATILEGAPGLPLLASGASSAYGVTASPASVNQLTPVTALPTPDESYRGEFMLLTKDGLGDQLVICMKNSDDSYAWRPLVYAA
jgi:hypothetical protein